MDYHSLKRKELQALCKKHNIPANSANSVLADKLSTLLNEKQKPVTRQRTCMKSTNETTEEGKPGSSKRQKKKVRFSPTNDLVQYALRSGEKQKDMVTQIKTRRKSLAKKVEKPVVDNKTTVELVDDSAQVPVKLTRSRVQSVDKDLVILNNENKRSRRVANDVKKETDADKEIVGNVRKVTRSKAQTSKIGGDVQHEEIRQSKTLNKDTEKSSESIEKTVASRARVTRSKAHNLMEGGTGPDVNPRIKKTNGKQAETDGQNVEPSKEIMDVPVRATRSTRQTPKGDIGIAFSNPPADKKRTRKEMKATDLRSNSSHDVQVDKKEPPKRKSLRTRGVVALDEDEGGKAEAVKVGRVTRSKAPLEMEASERNTRSKANKLEVQQPDEPSKHASKKNVNRRKSVFQSEKTDVVLRLEEAVNRPARENTRRKSVEQKQTKMVESPSVRKKQSKGHSGNLSNVIRSGKGASENEFKDTTTGSPKSRKRRGTPIIEDQIIETEYISPKSSTRSARKSEEKSVATNPVESSLKKSVSRMNTQSSVESASKGKSLAIRSGAIIRDSNSKKRAKLSGTKQSDSEDHDVNFSKKGTSVANMGNSRDSSSKKTAKGSESKLLQSDLEDVAANSRKEWTPVANMGKFKIDEEVTEAEVTPTIGKSDRRVTRSSVRSEIKEASQSAIKEQPIADNRLTSPKVAKFRPDPTVNTAPGRVTRSGIKHGGNAAGSFSEKVGKMKQASQLTRKKQSLDDAQMATPEVLEVGPNQDVGTKGVSSKIKKDFNEAQMSPLEDAEVGPNPDVQMSSPEVAELVANPDSDTAGAGSETFKEVTGQQLGNASASVSVKSPAEVMEDRDPVSRTFIDMECTSPVSQENASQEVMEATDAGVEKSTFEAGATPLAKFSCIRMTSDSMTDVVETVPDAVSDGSHVQNQNEEAHVESGIFSEAVNLETSVPVSERPDANEKETELTESGSILKGLQTDVMINDPLVSVVKAVVMEESVNISSLGTFIKGNSDADDNNRDSISYDVGTSAVFHASIQLSDVADDVEQNDEDESARALKPLMTEPVSEDGDAADGVVAPEIDSVEGDYDDESNRADTLDELTDDNKLQGYDTEGDIVTARDNIAEQSEPSTGLNVIYGLAIDGSDVEDDTGKQLAKEHDFEVVPSSSKNIHDIPVFGKSDGEDSGVNAAKESETNSMPSPACNMIQGPLLTGNVGEDEVVTTNEEHESNPKPLPDIDANYASPLGREPSIETPFSGKGIHGECDSAISERSSCLDRFDIPLIGKGYATDDGINPPKELETGSELSDPNKTLGVPVSHNDVDVERVLDDNSDAQDGEFVHDQLTSRDHLAIDDEDVGGDQSEPAQNESTPLVAEALVRSSDQEPEQMLNVAVDDVLCDMAGQSNSATSKDTPKTFATSGNDDMLVRVHALGESVLDINKDVVPSILGDTYDMAVEDDPVNEQRFTESDEGQLKERGGVPSITQDSFPIAYNKAEYSFLKSLSTTSATTQNNYVDSGQEDAVDFSCEDHYSFLKPSTYKSPACHVKVGQEDALSCGNQDHYSFLKSSFTTSVTSTTSHVNDRKADAVTFTFPTGRSNEDIGTSRTTAHEFNHQWEDDQAKDFDSVTQGNAISGSENEMYGVPSFGDDPLNLFGDDEVGSSIDRSMRNTHFEFKGDQVDQIKQFDFLSETAGTSHLDPSSFKDSSICSGEFEKEEKTPMKGSETDDHLAFDRSK